MISKRIFKKLLRAVASGERNWVSFPSTPSPPPLLHFSPLVLMYKLTYFSDFFPGFPPNKNVSYCIFPECMFLKRRELYLVLHTTGSCLRYLPVFLVNR